ncbi:MAG: (d)CMP kinase [Peptococcaceae bacterium]|nr:(d)CMP kinase [Peptococcaceae bacterium]
MTVCKDVNIIQIAIDGPSGAGKSTVAKFVADRLGFVYIDSGAMYRALTWKAVQNGVDPDDAAALTSLARDMSVCFHRGADGAQRVMCGGTDVTGLIRTPEIDRLVSRTAAHAPVRRVMVEKQRALAGARDVVMDGRDVAAVILPQAERKIFLTASLEERARRRLLELTQKGIRQEYPDLLEEMRNRDVRDAGRDASPLTRVPEAVVVDTSRLSFEETVSAVLEICQKERKPGGI